MLSPEQDYIFSTIVSEKTQENDFVIEFFSCEISEQNVFQPIKITHNFDELIDFFEAMED